MATNGIVLCVHRDPSQLGLLQENGYELVTASNGSDALRIFMSRPIDVIVLEYHLGLLDGVVVAEQIKRICPTVPIVMLAEHMELPEGTFKYIDALATESDGPHFLCAAVHFAVNVKPTQVHQKKSPSQTPVYHPRRESRPQRRPGFAGNP
jgi:CheY-like chemotaxis protein